MKRVILGIFAAVLLLLLLLGGGTACTYYNAKWSIEKATEEKMSYSDTIVTKDNKLGIGFTPSGSLLRAQRYYYIIPGGEIKLRILDVDLLIPYNSELSGNEAAD